MAGRVVVLEAALPVSWRAIELAVAQGYSGDADAGTITGKSGRPLAVVQHPGQQYPTIRLHVSGLHRKAYSVPAHKFMAFVIWGRRALIRGANVRHGQGGVEDIRRSNLSLGSWSENELDKPAAVRRASAAAARASQGLTPLNAILTQQVAESVRARLKANLTSSGRVRRGVVKDLAAAYGVSPSTISLIGKGATWAA